MDLRFKRDSYLTRRGSAPLLEPAAAGALSSLTAGETMLFRCDAVFVLQCKAEWSGCKERQRGSLKNREGDKEKEKAGSGANRTRGGQ